MLNQFSMTEIIEILYLKFAWRNDLWHAANWSAHLSTSDRSILRDSELLWRSAKWRNRSNVLLIFSKKFLTSELSCSIWRWVVQSPLTKETVDVLILRFKRTSSSRLRQKVISVLKLHKCWGFINLLRVSNYILILT